MIVDLPEPKLPTLLNSSMTMPDTSELAAKTPQRPATPPPAAVIAPSSAQKQRTERKNSLEFPEADPWGSPALHRDHNHEASPPKANGLRRETSNGVREPVRTTSTFITSSTESSNGASNPPSDAQSVPATGVWGSYDTNTAGAFSTSGSAIGGGGFDPSGGGGEGPIQNIPSRSFGGGRVTSGAVEENVIITLLPEKEGIFMFQHHNYQVASARRGSKVVRRYSDFVWLLDCLQKRYPFRQLPLLPPKRVGGKLHYSYLDSKPHWHLRVTSPCHGID
jgi:sorting nexin-8